MDDVISKQAVKELAHNQVREKYCGVALKEHRDFYIKLADSIIDLLPTIQPEIVRCKDCKHRYVDGDNVRYNACELNHNNVQSDDWFCADGERREVTT